MVIRLSKKSTCRSCFVATFRSHSPGSRLRRNLPGYALRLVRGRVTLPISLVLAAQGASRGAELLMLKSNDGSSCEYAADLNGHTEALESQPPPQEAFASSKGCAIIIELVSHKESRRNLAHASRHGFSLLLTEGASPGGGEARRRGVSLEGRGVSRRGDAPCRTPEPVIVVASLAGAFQLPQTLLQPFHLRPEKRVFFR